jgi:hydroxymethylbilane synthase
LASFGGVGVFTREIQQAVLDGRADVAVHSLKDLPTQPVAGLQLAGVPRRGPRFDALVLPLRNATCDLSALDVGARIGTGSPRRQAQLRYLRPDLQPLEVRGNVETRLQKLDDGAYDALILAQAGLERLSLGDRCSVILSPPQLYPAVGQAALGLECRTDDDTTARLLWAISDAPTFAEVTAERACLHELRAGCHAPVGVWCVADHVDTASIQIRMMGVVLSLDGRERVQAESHGSVLHPNSVDAAVEFGRTLAERLIAAGADRLLR